MKVANYEQTKEKNEKMKKDWQEEGGKIKERRTVCEQYNKERICFNQKSLKNNL